MGKQFNSGYYVRKWRAATKARIIEAFGGGCCICGYNKSIRSLHTHHLDPDTKDKSLNQWLSNPRSWAKIVAELRKCVLLCANCHGEIHDGLTTVPHDAKRFDETFTEYKELDAFDICPICGGEKRKTARTCSYRCAARKSFKTNWDSLDLAEMMTRLTWKQIGDELGVSDTAVRKRAKRLGIYIPDTRFNRKLTH